jgi:hypothetical protein
MRLHRKTIWRSAAAGAALVLVAGIVAPFLSVNRYGQRIRESLEEALGRKVELGEVRLDLFSGPGFSVSKVVIHEDPRFGIEPFAYIGSLEARVSFRSLWSGRLEFASLRLDEPSINLVRTHSGSWNFQPLLARAARFSARFPEFPEIGIRGGRVNFKFGDTKSVFYFTGPNMDVLPPSSPEGEWRIRFSGQPARTDRAAYGFGRFSGRGRWMPGGRLDLLLELERSPIAELIMLIHGHDIGVHGHLVSRARLSGPISDIRISGRMQVSGIHRWDLMPPHGEGWPVEYHGRLDLVSQTLQMETVSPQDAPLPVTLRFRADDYLRRPRWGLLMSLGRLPAEPLAEIARHMGVPLPDGLSVHGELQGVVGYSPFSGLQGKLASADLSLGSPETGAVRLAKAEIVLDKGRVSLAPAALLTSRGERATIAGDYSWADRKFAGRIQTDRMSISELRAGSLGLLGTDAVPLLVNFRSGAWMGELRYHGGGEWSGIFEVENADVPLPGFAVPLEIGSAHVVMRDGGAVMSHLRARMGQAEFGGEYRYRPKAARPHWFRVSAVSLDASELERVLLPALRRSEGGFLARALRLGGGETPAWLEERRAEGRVEIGSLTMGVMEFEKVRGLVRWDATAVEVAQLDARLGHGRVEGGGSLSLRRPSPAYRLSAQWHSVQWGGGEWDGQGTVQTTGTGRDLLRNLQSEGVFSARSIEVGEDTQFEAVSGSYQLAVLRGIPRLGFTRLQAAVGEETFEGKGLTRDDGRLYLEFSDGRTEMRMSGTVLPLQLVRQHGGVAP